MPEAPIPDVPNLVDLLRLRAELRPDGLPHVFSADGEGEGERLSHRGLDHGARTVAAGLVGRCSAGDRALLLYPPGLDFNRAFWGCLYAGVIGIPVAPPQLSKLEAGLARLRSITANSGARVLLTTAAVAERLGEALPLVGGFEGLRIVATDQLDGAAADDWSPVRITGDSVAYLQYSSGSTGDPKGVVLTHANVLANLAVIGRALRATPESRGVVWLPTFHDMGLLSAVTLPVAADFTVWQMSPLAFVQRPLRWLRMISQVGATHSVAPNFAYDLCARRISAEQAAELSLSRWQVALCGAEPVQPQTLTRFAEAFAAAGFRRETLFPCFGLAEATLMVTGGPAGSGVRTLLAEPEALKEGRITAVSEADRGRALVASGEILDGLEVRIADGDTLEPLPEGEVGEIFVAGDSVAAGYWNNPVATEEAFGLGLGGRTGSFLRTGDLGFLRDGQLWVTGRRKDLIIVDGGNHYPQDIEFSAASSHPAVRANGCAAFQDEDEEGAGLVLVVEVDSRYRVTADPVAAVDERIVEAAELTRTVRQAVSAAHQLRVDRLYLVKPRTIPLTSSGKIQRHACRELAASGRLADRSVLALAVPTPAG